MLGGIIDKNALGAKGGSLIDIMFMDLGPDRAKQFMLTIQKVVNNFLLSRAYTISMGDAVADDLTCEKINKRLAEAKQKVKKAASPRDL